MTQAKREPDAKAKLRFSFLYLMKAVEIGMA